MGNADAIRRIHLNQSAPFNIQELGDSLEPVCYLLIYFSQQIYYALEFDLPLSRKEMAEYVGMTTENVIRTLSEFRKDGILKIYGKTIQIVQMDTLKSIAEFG